MGTCVYFGEVTCLFIQHAAPHSRKSNIHHLRISLHNIPKLVSIILLSCNLYFIDLLGVNIV